MDMAKNSNPNEIQIIRNYEAPVKIVWEAWTDPSKAAHWWGPRGFTITTHSKDLRVGGSWNYTMHGPDGVDYPNETKYFEVEKYKKLVYDHGGGGGRPPLFRVTVVFSEQSGKTTMDMTMAFATAEIAQETRKFIKAAGGDGTWDRLAEFLEKQNSDKEIFVINRTFNASIETMYEVWTKPKNVSEWTPPTGFTMRFIRADIRAGGGSFYEMSNGAGVTMYGRANYIELTRPNRVVYTQQFCDKDEKISRHPMAPVWPETMKTTVTLFAEDAHHTRVTITWEPFGQATKEEVDTFAKARGGMTQGWSGSFEKLEQFLVAFSKS
jgi:uncharacterized protein YndB with AHSA1/START domain